MRLPTSLSIHATRKALNRPLPASLIMSVVIFLGIMAVRNTGSLQPLELAAYDWHLWLRPPNETPKRIALLTITELDIRARGHWPLPDAIMAELLARLVDYGPIAVGVNIYLDVPVAPGREELDAVLSAHREISVATKFEDGSGVGILPPAVLKGTDQIGFNDVVVDPGGIVRRALLFLDDGQTAYLSLPLRLALAYLEGAGIGPEPDPENPAHVRLGRSTIEPFEPNDGGYVQADAAGYQFLLDYRDPVGGFQRFTLTDLLSGFLDPRIIQEKIVLVGVDAESVKDFFYTPHSRSGHGTHEMRGVELLGHTTSQLLRAALDGDKPVVTIRDPHEAAWILLWSVLGGLVGLFSRSVWRFSWRSLGGLLLLFGTVHLLFLNGLWLPVIPAAIAWLTSASLVSAYASSREKQERDALMSLFSRHISPQLASRIWEEREQFLSGNRPRSQKLTATVLFTDIHGFTTTSESLKPQVLIDWLNEFMEAITPTVEAHGGVILRFLGDSVMAVFGVPVARTSEAEIRHDATNAVSCALEMEKRLIELNHRLAERGLPLIGMRMGILTGPMVAGSVGTMQRLEYNVHGDTVNTASRLEGYDKKGFTPAFFHRPCRILIGESVRAYLDERFRTQEIGRARLRGKAQEVSIYRVHGYKEPAEHANEARRPAPEQVA